MGWQKLITSGSDAHLNTVTASKQGSPLSMPNIQAQAIGNPTFKPLVVDTDGTVWKTDETFLSQAQKGELHWERYFVSASSLATGSIAPTSASGSAMIDIVMDDAGDPNFHTSMVDTSNMSKATNDTNIGTDGVMSGSVQPYIFNIYNESGLVGKINFTSGQDAVPVGTGQAINIATNQVMTFEVWLSDYPTNDKSNTNETLHWSPQGQNLGRI